METQQKWRVLVTYGTMRNATYACVPTKEDAEKLKDTAFNLGYRDARIVEDRGDAPSFYENATPERCGSSRPKRAYQKAR